MDRINTAIREGDPELTLLALMKPEAQLPTVYRFAAALYQSELFTLQEQSDTVSWESQVSEEFPLMCQETPVWRWAVSQQCGRAWPCTP